MSCARAGNGDMPAEIQWVTLSGFWWGLTSNFHAQPSKLPSHSLGSQLLVAMTITWFSFTPTPCALAPATEFTLLFFGSFSGCFYWEPIWSLLLSLQGKHFSALFYVEGFSAVIDLPILTETGAAKFTFKTWSLPPSLVYLSMSYQIMERKTLKISLFLFSGSLPF